MAGRRVTLMVSEAARLVGVSEHTLRREIREGRFPAMRLGGPGSRLVVPKVQLQLWLEGRWSPDPERRFDGARANGVDVDAVLREIDELLDDAPAPSRALRKGTG